MYVDVVDADLLTRVRVMEKKRRLWASFLTTLLLPAFSERTLRRVMNLRNELGSIHVLIFVGVSCCWLFHDVEKALGTPSLWRDEGWNWWVAD